MRKKEISSIDVNSDPNYRRIKKPFIIHQEKKPSYVPNLLRNSNDSIINNSNNDIMDDDENINEENIFDKSIGEQILHTPINETHRLFSSKTRFGKSFINSIPLKRILIPKSKSPNIRSHGSYRFRNEKKNNDNLKKNLTSINKIFSLNNDFLHCRNCMLIVALSRYGKYYFNK